MDSYHLENKWSGICLTIYSHDPTVVDFRYNSDGSTSIVLHKNKGMALGLLLAQHLIDNCLTELTRQSYVCKRYTCPDPLINFLKEMEQFVEEDDEGRCVFEEGHVSSGSLSWTLKSYTNEDKVKIIYYPNTKTFLIQGRPLYCFTAVKDCMDYLGAKEIE
jgi:hypothetical protein